MHVARTVNPRTEARPISTLELQSQPFEPYHGQSRTKISEFRGFDSRIILSLWGGILMSIGGFP